MKTDWNFVIGTTLLIVYTSATLADFLQGGISWPCLLLAIGVQAFPLVMRALR